MLIKINLENPVYITLDGFTAYRIDQCVGKPAISDGCWVDDLPDDIEVVEIGGWGVVC